MDKAQIVHEISEILFKLFVANNKAAGIQQKGSGIYYTKYFNFTPYVIESMIQKDGSIGCYQQPYKSDRIKWICLDYDCKDKENPNIEKLYDRQVKPVCAFLKELGIKYVTEFSGRRGIHIWVLFDGFISKKQGFDIVNAISSTFPLNEAEFGVDLFPAAPSSKNNKVGKQVKMPLSTHGAGGRSYFFDGTYEAESDTNSKSFFKKQLDLLNNVKLNNLIEVFKVLHIDNNNEEAIDIYKKISISNFDLSVSEAISALSDCSIFKEIFSRFISGCSYETDWRVLFGTFSCINNSDSFLLELLKQSPNFSFEKSKEMLLKLKGRYFSPTFDYLSKIYKKDLESGIDKEMTSTEYLCKKLGQQFDVIANQNNYKDIKTYAFSVPTIINKEMNYIVSNDENVSIMYYLNLQNFKEFDANTITEIISRIHGYDKDEIVDFVDKLDIQYYQYLRDEEKKVRSMISLSPIDRVLTTSIAVKLSTLSDKKPKSYSYNVSLISKDDIFYNWFSSWNNYIDVIRTYLNVPFLGDYYVISIDIKNYYDSIDFASMSKKIFGSENNKELMFLVAYNEKLMRLINNGRIGVPQGPAYARIIAEYFLESFIDDIYASSNSNDVRVIRYVDDITIFCSTKESAIKINDSLGDLAHRYGLMLNSEKTKFYGKIRDLTNEEKDTLLRKNKFNYLIRESDSSFICTQREKIEILNDLISKFDISDVNFVFGKSIEEFYKYYYFIKYGKDIFKSSVGRGSSFAKFYSYIFNNESIFELCLNQNYFLFIPKKSLNFSNFLSVLYIAIHKAIINVKLVAKLNNAYLSTLTEGDCINDDFSTLESIRELFK